MMRGIPYILYMLLIAFYRTNLIGLFSIGEIHINLTALIVLLVALNKEYTTALWFAVAAGIVYDAPDPSHLGVHMIILSVISVVTSEVKERLNLDSIMSRVLLLTTGLLLYSIPQTLIYATSGASEFFRLMLSAAVPSTIYTAAFGWLFFMIQIGRLSYAKLKAMF